MVNKTILSIAETLMPCGQDIMPGSHCGTPALPDAERIYMAHVKPLEDALKKAEKERNAALLEACDYGKECIQAKGLLIETLERLARLGNGDRYGNSDGNIIAQEALARVKGDL